MVIMSLLRNEGAMDNKELIAEYPFLLPRNVFTDKVLDSYDYSYTLLDDMPKGWKLAFGEQMCKELKRVLIDEGFLYDYRILQIKEKFGQLRWYDNCGSEMLWKVISKYEDLSKYTCIECGNKGKVRKLFGWISPYCDDCYKKVKRRAEERLTKHSK